MPNGNLTPAFMIGLLGLVSAVPALAVTHSPGTVLGLAVDVWSWTDSLGHPRSLALKQEGNGNPGHGGYAVQMTYQFQKKSSWKTARINAQPGPVGGFGFFISHERYRNFADGTIDTIADHIFNENDSPPGLNFPATARLLTTRGKVGAEQVTIQYQHYGTNFVDPITSNGEDSIPLPVGQANYTLYTLPVTTTWVVEDGVDYPRLDLSVDLSHIALGGGPMADLVSFNLAGPYGMMNIDNGGSRLAEDVFWGDQDYRFVVNQGPVIRDSAWDWSVRNTGARYVALTSGEFEMGLFEPRPLSTSATLDGYAGERGMTSTSYAAAGLNSFASCTNTPVQILPTDGNWPYESVQFSLSCSDFHKPTTAKVVAWGSNPYYGTSLASVNDGTRSVPFNGFPANHKLAYSVCLVLGHVGHGKSLTEIAANKYAELNANAGCAKARMP